MLLRRQASSMKEMLLVVVLILTGSGACLVGCGDDESGSTQTAATENPENAVREADQKRACGSFRQAIDSKTTYRIFVHARETTCGTAIEILRDFWDPGVRKRSNGGDIEAKTFYTMADHPGWRCTQGAGAGQCANGSAIAGYENQVE